MNIGKKIAILVFAAAMSVFAIETTNVAGLVDQINNTKDIKEKTELKKKLQLALSAMNEKDLPKAKEIIDAKLEK